MPRKQKSRERKGHSGRQCAALPLAVRDGEIMVMLVTSRETRRWVLPKGWAEADLPSHE
jgi:8-oxo-dGTP pyrophosphatase MutT (NUDIX family)